MDSAPESIFLPFNSRDEWYFRSFGIYKPLSCHSAHAQVHPWVPKSSCLRAEGGCNSAGLRHRALPRGCTCLHPHLQGRRPVPHRPCQLGVLLDFWAWAPARCPSPCPVREAICISFPEPLAYVPPALFWKVGPFRVEFSEFFIRKMDPLYFQDLISPRKLPWTANWADLGSGPSFVTY